MRNPKRPSETISETRTGAIVSSEHLASEKGWELSEFEYGLTIAYNAFTGWMTRCMTAVGYPDFSPLDVLVLHNVNHRGREKRLLDITFMLKIDDQHTVNYSVKKLVKLGLLAGQKRGKEMFYSTTASGKKACENYRKVREQCLIAPFESVEHGKEDVRQMAAFLRLLSGIYDQASRAASSL